MRLVRVILGRLIANRESEQRKLGAFEGVPAMGLDALASSAYGPEAALSVLIPVGVAGLAFIGPIMAAIVALLAILYISYRQIIRAYPSNGGSYTVTKANIGASASLLAAAALMVDYVLNVSVGISTGVGALVSAVPLLHSYQLALCLAVLAAITVVNLRGTLDAGRLFALPTYLFIASFLALIAMGIAKSAAAGGSPMPVVAPHPLAGASEAGLLWLVLRAFASGCTAMTGVEAVSNGVSAFREPVVGRAYGTLSIICAVLALLLLGIAYLSWTYGIGAMDQTMPGYQSVLSQMAAAVAGRSTFYYVAMASLFAVLVLSANTSFVGFPLLCRLVADDGYLPRPFRVRGRRLVFSAGIAYLAICSAILLIVFGGITDRLIPLFAIGAFLTFTLAQSGMVVHWWKAARTRAGRERLKSRVRMAINGVGAIATGTALAIIVVAKFTEGGWITILVIPLVILMLRLIRSYYDEIERQLRLPGPVAIHRGRPPIVLLIGKEWNRLTDHALDYALRISPDVVAVHVRALEGPDATADEELSRQRWASDVEAPARAAGITPPRLVIVNAPFRRIHVPILKLVERMEREFPGRAFAVLIPEVVKRRLWERLLHTRAARRLSASLLRYGGSRVAVIELPWHLEEPSVEEAMEPEEKPATGVRRDRMAMTARER